MFGYEPRKVMDGRSLSFATREKAVLDLLYLYPSQPDYGFLAAKCGINKLQELKAAISKRLDSVDLQQKKKDFEHLLFNQSSSDRILHFKDFIQAL
jgi:hypothetical protein